MYLLSNYIEQGAIFCLWNYLQLRHAHICNYYVQRSYAGLSTANKLRVYLWCVISRFHERICC